MNAVATPDFDLDAADLTLLLDNIDSYSAKEQAELLKILDKLQEKRRLQAARDDLIAFCCLMQPDYKVGKHHRILANMLMALERDLEGVTDAEGVKDRICVNMPPRHGKSQLISIYFPAWFLGRNPDKKILMVSHTTDLAESFGRKVRNLLGTDEYAAIFPRTKLAIDSKAARRWNTSLGGEYFACGVGSALAGRGAHLLLVDDPHNEQDIINGNLDVFEKAYEWFTYGARTRLMPRGRVAVVQCMTGDTEVLLSSGGKKQLQDIRPGDRVASYRGGELVSRAVLNWQLSGLDSIHAIKTTCGKLVHANARHPFLVWHPEGVTTWVQLQHLKPGDFLVSLPDAPATVGRNQNQVSATPVAPGPARRTGATSSYVTTVTSQRVTPKHLRSPEPWPTTSTFIPVQIESITAAGTAEVFDIEVEETENFIANSIVSSNTRWHMDDLTGRLTRDMAQNELADKYEVVEFPAIFEVEQRVEEPTDPDNPDSPTTTTTRIVEKALWPEFYDIPALHRTKASMPLFQWNAQYQQNPTAEEAAVVKREWWNLWPHEDPPSCEYIIMSLDAAAETNNRADFTALTVWGVFKYEGTVRDNEGSIVGVPDSFNLILLNAVKRRVEFPELKDLAHQEYRQWQPDSFIVEKKSSGAPLYQELRRAGLMVQEYTPHRGSGDKMARLNSVADIIRSRMVWVPQTRWAEEVVEEVAGFPFMSHDDLVDSTVMALMRFRQGGFLRLPSDEAEPERFFKGRRGGYY